MVRRKRGAAFQGGVGHSEGGLQPDDAEGGGAVFQHLVFAVLGAVVAHDGVDGAVLHAFAQGFDVYAQSRSGGSTL